MRILLIVFGLTGLFIAGQAAVGFFAPPEGGYFEDRVIRVTREVAAPETPLTDARSGEETTLAAFRGEVAVVSLWATWCSVCLTEMPKLAALQERYAGRGLSVVTVSVDEEDAAAKVLAHLDQRGLGGLPPLLDPDHLLAAQVGMRGTPTTIVVDRFGQVVAAFEGLAPWGDEATHDWLAALLAAESAEASRLLLTSGAVAGG